jgi:hypothetical protein
MNLKDIEIRLRAIAAGEQEDAELAAATTRRDGLQHYVTEFTTQLTARRRTLVQLEVDAETALLAGKVVDDRPLAKTQDEIRALESRVQMHVRAHTEAVRRVTELEQARGGRIERLLKPIFVDLVVQLDQQIDGVAATERLLDLAHQTATGALGSASSLAQGYCLFAPQRLEWWRARVRDAGLLLPAGPGPSPEVT